MKMHAKVFITACVLTSVGALAWPTAPAGVRTVFGIAVFVIAWAVGTHGEDAGE